MSGSINIANSSFTADAPQCVTITGINNSKYWVEHKVTGSDIS